MFFAWLIVWLLMEVALYQILKYQDRKAATKQYPDSLKERHTDFVLGGLMGSLCAGLLAVFTIFLWKLMMGIAIAAALLGAIAYFFHWSHNRNAPKA